MLKTGQVIKYEGGLWKVDYVNQSRARIIPLAKRHVVLKDAEGNEKREFDAIERGVNISPNSDVEIVTDTTGLESQLEMIAIEKELKRLKAKAAKETEPKAETPKQSITRALKQAPVATPAPTAVPEGLTPAASGARGAGWYLVGTAEVIPASLKAFTVEYVSANPGHTTKQVADAIEGWNFSAVAACLDRFRKAGVMVSAARPAGEQPPAAPAGEKAPRVKKAKAPVPESTDF